MTTSLILSFNKGDSDQEANVTLTADPPLMGAAINEAFAEGGDQAIIAKFGVEVFMQAQWFAAVLELYKAHQAEQSGD